MSDGNEPLLHAIGNHLLCDETQAHSHNKEPHSKFLRLGKCHNPHAKEFITSKGHEKYMRKYHVPSIL